MSAASDPAGRYGAEVPVAGDLPGTVAIGDPGRAPTAVVPRPDARFPFRHDIVTDSARVVGQRGALDVLGASVRGLSHRFYGKVRQDEFAYVTTGDGRWLVAAVADGVSSGDHSHLAADTVCEEGCRLIERQLVEREPGNLDWRTILNELGAMLVDLACQRFGLVEPTLADIAEVLAATALFAVVGVEPLASGERPVYVMSVGDTSAWLLGPDGDPAWRSLQEVKNATNVVASSATAALPGLPCQLAPAVETRLRPDEVLVLMSDGVGDPLGGGGGEVGRYLADAWRRPPDPFTFTAQVGFHRRSYDDDRTAVAVWPVP